MDYGKEIAGTGFTDIAARLKNRIMTRIQYRMLNLFESIEGKYPWDRLFTKAARSILGSHLYSLKLELNNTCNLKCRMCYVRHGDEILSMNLLSSIYRQLRGCGVRIELLGGEPLLRDDITEIIRAAKETALSPLVTLYTSGIHAGPGLSRNLAAAGLDGALVTVVSHRPEVHDSFCGVPGTWKKMTEGIRNLTEAGIKVYTFTAVHRENHLECREIDSFSRNALGVTPIFYQYIPQIKNDPLELNPGEWDEVKQWAVENTSRTHMDFVRRFYMLSGSACSGGNFVLTVKVDGSVQPCPFVSDVPLGSVYDQDIWTIFRNRYRGTRLREFKELPDECRECTYRSVCAGGCRAACGMLFGSYSRKDQRCPGPYRDSLNHRCILSRAPTFF
jgi:radical SAM protein with 4Fe4S-binding SPASM domain